MADNKLKFLDIVGLTQLVSEIKTKISDAINTATNSTLINTLTYDKASSTLTIKQGTDDSHVKTVTLDAATEGNSGLMTAAHVSELARLNTAKLDKVALRIDGKQDASLFSTSTVKVDGKDTQVAVIDYTTNLSDKTSIQAPTAGAVATALDTKVNTETYEAKVKDLDDAIKANTAKIEKKLDAGTYATDKAAIEKSITDGLALKVDKTTYEADKQAQSLKDQNQDDLIEKHENFLYTGDALNVYTKNEVNAEIDNAKKAILLGDATGEIAKAYDTIKEIADWISSNDGADDAAGLTKDVATLKSTTQGHSTAIEGLQADVKTIVGEDGKSGLIVGLDSRLGIAEGDIDDLEAELNTANTGVKARLTALESELNTETTGVKARLSTAEGDIDKLQSDYEKVQETLDTINGKDSGLALKADKTKAVGSIENLVWNGTTNAYEMVYTSVSGAELNRVSFQVFTADDITALFA